MNYFRRTLPSLDALVFFEAAARSQNYTRAAKELHVTQVAVSKRVRALEEELGTTLFRRKGRNLELTEDGRAFAERIRSGLTFLEEAISVARGRTMRTRQVIHVAANENMNFFWLAPIARAFQMQGNDAVVSVVSANNVNDVLRSDTDLAIFHGRSPPEGWTCEVLFEEVIGPVASKQYLDQVLGSDDAPITLLEYRRETPDWVNWETLLPAGAETWFSRTSIRQCTSYIQSISLAMEGAGIGLGVLPMLGSELDDARLVQLGGHELATGRRYYLAVPEGKAVSSSTREFMEFIADVGRGH